MPCQLVDQGQMYLHSLSQSWPATSGAESVPSEVIITQSVTLFYQLFQLSSRTPPCNQQTDDSSLAVPHSLLLISTSQSCTDSCPLYITAFLQGLDQCLQLLSLGSLLEQDFLLLWSLTNTPNIARLYSLLQPFPQ